MTSVFSVSLWAHVQHKSKDGSPFNEFWLHNWCNLLANGFFQSPFEANKLFCFLNKLVFFNNHRQLLKCVKQNSYLDLWSYTSYIIWQGVHILVKLQAGGTNKYTTKMKSLTDIFQGFDKCTEATLQNNYFWWMPPNDCFYLETWHNITVLYKVLRV